MKPLHLKMRAFGPYATEQVIDFEPLCARELFLIHGPTGGGKTTILDAICFALYGETTGDRTGEQMRSQTAEQKTPTEVTLVFGIGDKRYRVTRQPRQLLPGRGGVLRDQPPQASLFEITGGSETPIAERANKVTEAVTKLLGFSAEQFRQVIMLPQGKFRELLLAKSDQREEILKTLFGTAYYERLQDALAEASREVKDKLVDRSAKRSIVLAQAGAQDEVALKKKIADLTAEAEAKKAHNADLEQKARVARESLSAAKAIAEKLNAVDGASKRLADLDRSRPEIAKKQDEIDQATKAQRVAPAEQEYRQRQREVQPRQGAMMQATSHHEVAVKSAAAAQARLIAAQRRADKANEDRQQLGKVQGLEAKIGRLGEAELAMSRTAAAMTTAEAAERGVRDDRERKTDTREKLTAQLVELRALDAQSAGLDQAAVEAKRLLDARVALDRLAGPIAKAQKELAAGKTSETKAQKALDEAKEKQRLLLVAWTRSSAARLAGELKHGQACPVCGSLEHPKPATSSGTIPTQDEIDAAEVAVSTADAARSAAAKTVARCGEELVTLQSEAKARLEALDGDDTAVVALTQKLAAAKKAAAAAAEARKKVPEAEKQEKALANELEQLLTCLETLQGEVSKARDAATKARTTRDECVADLPDALRTRAAWEAEVRRLADLVTNADKELVGAQSEDTAAQRALSAAKAALTQAKAEHEQAMGATIAAKERFLKAVAEQGFTSESAYAAAKLAEPQVKQRQEWIAARQGEIQEAQGALAQAQEQARGLGAPDLNSLQEATAAAEQSLGEAQQKLSDLQAQAKTLATLDAQLAQIAGEFAELERKYAIIGKLADSATGANPMRLKFHRYVLGSLLDDVLWAASQRLKTMTRGRYRLDRVQTLEDKRMVGGLDLEVFDAYTGQSRPVATLSGGESFQASLSLSLGLADAVGQRAGGIRMETMFIDEGFGSLDAESLDEAMNAIRDLQQGGRVVGIISHVPELRQVVGARIEITSSGQGSEARVCLA